MNDPPMVSIISISYNHEKYIEETLKGFLDQKTDFSFEIVIADDCSTDDTQKIISRYARKYPDKIIPVLRKKNLGPRGNNYDALSRARGKYVALCEGDDYWIDENKLQTQVDYLENHPEIGLVHTDNDVIYDSTGKIVHSMNRHRNEFMKKCKDPLVGMITGKYVIHTLTVVVKREYLHKAINSNTFNDERNLQGDLSMWLEIIGMTGFHYIPEVTAVYRLRKGSLSRQKDMIRSIEFQESSKRLRLEFARKYGVRKEVQEIAENNYHYIILLKSYYLRDKTSSTRAYNKISKKSMETDLIHLGTKYPVLRLGIEPVRRIRGLLKIFKNRMAGRLD